MVFVPLYMFASKYQIDFVVKQNFCLSGFTSMTDPIVYLFVDNLSWNDILQDSTTIHAYGRFVALGNFLTLDIIRTFKESWRYMIPPLIQS